MKKSGYVTEDQVIKLAAAAGLHLEERSEINANPRDTHDHPAGVWSLQPGFRYCRGMSDEQEQSHCMEQYTAIGESDRMTLRFRKD
jgi:predicted methyltransferase